MALLEMRSASFVEGQQVPTIPRKGTAMTIHEKDAFAREYLCKWLDPICGATHVICEERHPKATPGHPWRTELACTRPPDHLGRHEDSRHGVRWEAGR